MLTEEAFVEACAYAMANPVAAGLVRRGADWIGFRSQPKDLLGRDITLARPACLPDNQPNLYPAAATLRFALPAHLQAYASRIVEAVDTRVRELEREARDRHFSKRHRYPSAEQLRAVDPFDAPNTPRKRGLAPMLRAANAAVMRVAKKQITEWRRAYRRAFEAFRRGRRNVEWPPGTWYYAKYAGVRVAPDDRAVFGVG